MKVLMISVRSDIGGGPAQMLALINGLHNEVEFYCALPSSGIFYDGVTDLIGAGGCIEIPARKFSIFSFFKIILFCYKKRIDVVHSHGKGAGVYSRLLRLFYKCKVIHTLHGFHFQSYSLLGRKLYFSLESLLSRLTDKVIAVSRSERDDYFKHSSPKCQIVTIYNGTPSFSSIEPELNKYNSKFERPVVLVVARLTFQKNIREALLVASCLPNFMFRIVGDGELKEDLVSLCKELKLENVVFVGELNRVEEIYSQGDVFFLPSRWEGFALAPLEAMSFGLPVVLSAVVGNSEAVSEGVNGYLYQLGDVHSASAKIESALSLDKSVVRDFHRDNFSSARMVGLTLKQYQ